ncbi:S8 family peptidase [Calidifontibacillus oryziterrae]|uniref:S8 family peptidase n=1 Tax=Calidifontibacillus oryziterrae TaxID=1191699 RepID=UPI0002FE5D51|nr:S8 family serine peptidase [Calidifontibacillus oryziterrae]
MVKKQKIYYALLIAVLAVPIIFVLFLFIADFNTDDIIVAVIDTGVDYNHEFLKGKVLDGIDVVDFDQNPMDEFGHGTHVSGIIVKNAPAAKILPIRTLNKNGVNGYFPNGLCILYAIMKGADIINMSYSSKSDPTTSIAVKFGHMKGVIFVGAAGDQNSDGVKFPASLNEVISVGTVKPSMKKIYRRSNFGEDIDYIAPGVAILSSDTQKSYFKRTGTSMSAAYVSGAIAYLKTKNSRINSKTIKGYLDQDANTINDKIKYKVIDINKIKAINENAPYFDIKDIPLDYKNAEINISYEALFIDEIKIFNNHKLISTVNPIEQKKISVDLKNGTNLIRFVAKSKTNLFIKEIKVYKNKQKRIIEDRTAL